LNMGFGTFGLGLTIIITPSTGSAVLDFDIGTGPGTFVFVNDAEVKYQLRKRGDRLGLYAGGQLVADGAWIDPGDGGGFWIYDTAVGGNGTLCHWLINSVQFAVNEDSAQSVNYITIDSTGAPIADDPTKHLLSVTEGTDNRFAGGTPASLGGGIYLLHLTENEVADGGRVLVWGVSSTPGVFIKPETVDLVTAQGSPSLGDGDTAVNHDNGGIDNLRYTRGDGVTGIANATVRAYVRTDYDAGNLTNLVGRTITKDDGRWVDSLMLNSGVEYAIRFELIGQYGPDVKYYEVP
jgi:hypothetical protein